MNEKQIEKALNVACLELCKMCKQTKCKDCHFVKEQETSFNECPVPGNCVPEIWKEWSLEKAKGEYE